MLSMSCVCHAFESVHCCFVVTYCKEMSSWLLLVVSNCDFVTFLYGVPGWVWYLIVLIPDLCRLSYFYNLGVLRINIQRFTHLTPRIQKVVR